MEQTANNNDVATPRFSVIIPTYQRRDIVLESVRALARQEFDRSFEVIVVVDGSNDGSAEALRELFTTFALTILEQQNQGAASARNLGAAAARGKILLFLDDDMEAHSRLLMEHDQSHRAGADVVLGHIPLHPNSPPGVLSKGVKSWAEERARRLSSPGASLGLHDLLTGQISLSRMTFDRLGGFDTNFTRGGSFGNEDLDFGYRLLREGYRVVYNPHAISWQYYAVQPRQYLRQWRQAGRADVLFVRKYPDEANRIFYRASRRLSRYLWRPLVTMPFLATPLSGLLRWLACRLVESGAQGPNATRFFFETRNLEYWRGVREAGDIPRSRPSSVADF
jgi:glycosyltransferase involved in cell wall biosynthesis